MSAKAKAMMERLNKNNAVLDNGKLQDLNVIFALFITFNRIIFTIKYRMSARLDCVNMRGG